MTGDCRVLSGSRIDASLKVSILMITYNQESFISQAIDSVLMQKVNFDYEIVLGEDCSTDKTRNIVIDFQRRYPDKVRLLLREYNSGMMNNFIHTFQALKGQYIAMLEGDDYWTDPYKLQKQVDLLESHRNCSMTFHNVLVINEDDQTNEPQKYYCRPMKTFYSLEDIVGGNFIHTCSVMYRSGLVKELPKWFCEMPIGDWPLHVMHAQHGFLGYIDEVLAAHRKHRGGRWSSKERIEILDKSIFALETVHRKLGLKYEGKVRASIDRWLREALRISLADRNFRNVGLYARRLMLNAFKQMTKTSR